MIHIESASPLRTPQPMSTRRRRRSRAPMITPRRSGCRVARVDRRVLSAALRLGVPARASRHRGSAPPCCCVRRAVDRATRAPRRSRGFPATATSSAHWAPATPIASAPDRAPAGRAIARATLDERTPCHCCDPGHPTARWFRMRSGARPSLRARSAARCGGRDLPWLTYVSRAHRGGVSATTSSWSTASQYSNDGLASVCWWRRGIPRRSSPGAEPFISPRRGAAARRLLHPERRHRRGARAEFDDRAVPRTAL